MNSQIIALYGIEPKKIKMTDENSTTNTSQTVASSTATGASSNQQDDPRLSKYKIPQVVKDKYPDLVILIIETKSMNDQERDYWFQILPIMTDQQVERLRNILTTEKQQLATLDKEYETEMNKLNQKDMHAWNSFEAKEKREEIQKEESADQVKETAKEEELLATLAEI